ncbi:hypothetical protein ACLOJK_007112 [Asimina triloba]
MRWVMEEEPIKEKGRCDEKGISLGLDDGLLVVEMLLLGWGTTEHGFERIAGDGGEATSEVSQAWEGEEQQHDGLCPRCVS